MPTPKEIQRLSYLKALKLEKLIEQVEKRIAESSNELTKTILLEFVQKLDSQQGRIVSTFDRRTLTLFNKAFNLFEQINRRKLIQSIVDDIGTILNDNHEFYKSTVKDTVSKNDIKAILDRRLGINPDGTLIRAGYMSGLLDTTNIKTEIQKYIQKLMFKSSGFEAFKKGLEIFIEGEPEKFGLFQRHYKAFSYDAYSQLNSFTSASYAQKLGLSNFIYNGGLIESSRAFCKKRNSEVFSTQEAEKWKDDPTLTAIENRETYNWLIDRGGYNCRHSIDFIADEIAYVLRPDLKIGN